MTTCPHCLGAIGGCIHCREHRAELSGVRRRSCLTNAERAILGLVLKPARVRKLKPVPANVRIPPRSGLGLVSLSNAWETCQHVHA